jgi:iron-sulfur cluster assembly accessory protein
LVFLSYYRSKRRFDDQPRRRCDGHGPAETPGDAPLRGGCHTHQGIDGEGGSPDRGRETMEYVESIGPTDEVVEDKGVKLLIDPKAVLFLIGTEMDWKIGKLSSQFVFNNPNQTSACGCGESVLLAPAKDASAKDSGAEAH